jgi:maltose alpha-D-glucosyltransferase / alpha-amylase
VGDLPYLLTLGGYAFYWFSLERPDSAVERAAAYEAPVVEHASPEALASAQPDVRALLAELLTAFVATRRWFRGRERPIASARIDETVSLGDLKLTLLRVDYASGETETYLVPLALAPDPRALPQGALIAIVRSPAGDVALIDALEEPRASRALLDSILARRQATAAAGTIAAGPVGQLPTTAYEGEPFNISAAHFSAAIRYGDSYLLKVFRRLEEGVSPEMDLGMVLNERAPGLTPQISGAIEYRRSRQEPSTLAVLQRYVANEGTAWSQARANVGRFYERVLSDLRDQQVPPVPAGSLAGLVSAEPPAIVRELGGHYFDTEVPLLGRRTADLHIALASVTDNPAYQPEPYSAHDRRSKYQSLRNLIGKTLRALRARTGSKLETNGEGSNGSADNGRLPERMMAAARLLVASESKILHRLDPLLARKVSGARIRTHGDLHLAQVLYTGKDYVFIDFDGGRSGTLAERRRKRSALKDVAGILRSFHYAAFTVLYDGAAVREADRPAAASWAVSWQTWMAASFLRGYLERAAGASFLPSTPEDLAMMVDILMLERAFLELREELESGSETVEVPLRGLIQILGL